MLTWSSWRSQRLRSEKEKHRLTSDVKRWDFLGLSGTVGHALEPGCQFCYYCLLTTQYLNMFGSVPLSADSTFLSLLSSFHSRTHPQLVARTIQRRANRGFYGTNGMIRWKTIYF